MTSYQRGVSLFLVWHLVSLSSAAVVPPDEAPIRAGERRDVDWLSRVMGPLVDAVGDGVWGLNAMLWGGSGFLRWLTGPYVRATALDQRWQMFTAPARQIRYLRVTCIWEPGRTGESGPVTTSAVVYPVEPDGELKLVASFANRFRNKAATNALEAFNDDRREGLGAYSGAFDALLAYHAERFARLRLGSGDRLVRAELWYGTKEIPAPGRRRREEAAAGDVVAPDGNDRPEATGGRPNARVGSVDGEADVRWTLVAIRSASS